MPFIYFLKLISQEKYNYYERQERRNEREGGKRRKNEERTRDE